MASLQLNDTVIITKGEPHIYFYLENLAEAIAEKINEEPLKKIHFHGSESNSAQVLSESLNLILNLDVHEKGLSTCV